MADRNLALSRLLLLVVAAFFDVPAVQDGSDTGHVWGFLGWGSPRLVSYGTLGIGSGEALLIRSGVHSRCSPSLRVVT
jgi:hypothetical protein